MVVITFTMLVKPELAESFGPQLAEMVKDTAKRPGFGALRIVVAKDQPNKFLMIEDWESEEAYAAYIAWRTERGDMAAFADALAAPPEMSIWPSTIASV